MGSTTLTTATAEALGAATADDPAALRRDRTLIRCATPPSKPTFRHVGPKSKLASAVRYPSRNRVPQDLKPTATWRRATRRFSSASVVKSRGRIQHTLTAIDLSWRINWISSQLEALPVDLQAVVTLNGETLQTHKDVTAVSARIEKFLDAEEDTTFDEIVGSIFPASVGETTTEARRELDRHRQLVFALLGWLTMLYQPAFNTCRPSELAIKRPADLPDSGLVFDAYRVSTHYCNRPLSILLKAFGNLLPARSPDLVQVASETAKAAASWTPIYPEELNASLLQSLAKVRFRWVDSLVLHLDYDKATRTLSLFAFPSVCAEALARGGAVFAFASRERAPANPRADEEGIRSLLSEVLLSYRLLFAQHPKARRLFQRLYNPAELPFEQPDTLLSILCTARSLGLEEDSTVFPEDHPVYFAPRHFPVLFQRIELLVKELDSLKPKSIQDLIIDRRDKLQWWTFWLISMLGGLGLILSLVQIVLQGVQISMGPG